MKGVIKVFQLMERCDGNGRGVRGVGRCDSWQEV